MKLYRASYAVLERAAKGMTGPEIDADLGVSSSNKWLRMLVHRQMLKPTNPGSKPLRFEPTLLGREALLFGPHQPKGREKPVGRIAKDTEDQHIDQALRSFFKFGGPMIAAQLADDLDQSDRFAQRLFVRMRDLGLVRSAGWRVTEITKSKAAHWVLTPAGLERLMNLDGLDWSARVAGIFMKRRAA